MQHASLKALADAVLARNTPRNSNATAVAKACNNIAQQNGGHATLLSQPDALRSHMGTAPLSTTDESVLRAWLAQIGEADSTVVARLFQQCTDDGAALVYFLGLARATNSAHNFRSDNRRTCHECANLTAAHRCLAAAREELAGAANNYGPDLSVPRRCEAFVALPDDADQRTVRERWPGLESDH